MRLHRLKFPEVQPGLYHQQFSQNLLMNVLIKLAEHCNNKGGVLESRQSSGTAKLILIRNFIDNRLQEGFTLDEYPFLR